MGAPGDRTGSEIQAVKKHIFFEFGLIENVPSMPEIPPPQVGLFLPRVCDCIFSSISGNFDKMIFNRFFKMILGILTIILQVAAFVPRLGVQGQTNSDWLGPHHSALEF